MAVVNFDYKKKVHDLKRVYDSFGWQINTVDTLSDKRHQVYFINYQIPLVVPSIVVLTIVHYFTQKYFDVKDNTVSVLKVDSETKNDFKPNAPLCYAIIPILNNR